MTNPTTLIIDLATLPAVGTDRPDLGGRVIGLLADEHNKPYLLLLGPEADEALDWEAATAWAAGVELNGVRDYMLPNRVEQALLFARARGDFQRDAYWSSEQHAEDADYAWGQFFGYGGQLNWYKFNQLRARAVRRLFI